MYNNFVFHLSYGISQMNVCVYFCVWELKLRATFPTDTQFRWRAVLETEQALSTELQPRPCFSFILR